MPTIIPVRFAYASRDLWFDPMQTEAAEGDHVICSTERGTEMGLATGDSREVSDKDFAQMTNGATLKPVLRVATEEDLALAEELAAKGEEAMPTFRRCIEACGLDMKPVGVEYLFDGDKAVCYFAAEDRVDFRQLVRDLSHELHVRIDMRQIGVREESAFIGGYGHCGQELCCARFGLAFEPVSIRMAKEQDLPLNSTKISGACGRLMCCLRYEFEAYRDFKSRAPKRNAVIETPLGKGKIIEYDTPKEQICLRLENGKQVRVALADMEASEAAHKKSEELGCPCRPDTVTRAALDKLESPEIKMALAELDRQMGVLPEETFDESDLFVETKPRRRRRKSSAGEAQAQAAQTASQSYRARQKQVENAVAEEEASTRQRRRRRKTQTAGEAPVAEAAAKAAAPTEAQPASSRRRRRHHVATEGEQAQAQTRAKAPEQQERPRGMQPTKRKRRPGDKGGAPVQDGAQAQAKGAKQQPKNTPKHRAPAPQQAQAQQGNAALQAQDGQAKPKRRRRHRGSRGRGKGGAEGAPASE